MTRIGQVARIKFQGYEHEGVDHNSPLEDQAVLVYKAARHYATMYGFEPHTHRGVPGVKGQMVMVRLVESLFPGADSAEVQRINGLVNQVLRKTDAAVCIKRPTERGEIPTWFVADKMPDNIVIVALSHSKKDNGTLPSAFDEQKFLRDRERKLTAEEAGETQPPGEVTVKRKTDDQPQKSDRTDRLREIHEEKSRWRAETKQRVLDEIQTNPVPLTVSDLQTILANEGTEIHTTTIRSMLFELVDEGHVVTRQETPEEKLVRGGGKAPAARRAILHWPAPGPVPTRDRLPDGIEPQRSMAEARQSKVDQDAEDDAKLLEFMETATGPDARLRTRLKLAERIDMPYERLVAAMDRLHAAGKVTQNGKSLWIATSRTRRDARPAPAETTPAPAETAAPQTNRPNPDETLANPILRQIVSLAGQLESSLGDTEKVTQLEAENVKLREENENLRKAVTGLRQALDALQ